ncbi:response regulator [Chitinolyticbacter meiyuanensis]|uniref:response regulator n=1 Tax=Chitinolyticbacter meiyuanensis TaxID=682798 RepID=UPI0011E5FEDD|nr:response regulator [Chitinolyticbacter meiyuanensis]
MRRGEYLQPQADPAAPTLSTTQAARQLGVSVRTVQLWLRQGKLHGWRTAGGHHRILASSLRLGEAVPQASTLRMLIVEDDPLLLELYSLTVGAWGEEIQVRTASDGVEALLAVAQWRPNLLLTDLDLPSVDGIQMIQRLRADPVYAALAIVIVTALSDAEIARRGGLPDRVPLVKKPLSFDWLRGFVDALLLKASHD